MRRAILRIRVRNEIRSLADLPASDLAEFLDGVFGVTDQPASIAGSQSDVPHVFNAVRKARSADDELVAETSLADAAQNVRQEARRRGWLSPKSQSALEILAAGGTALERGERNALDYLLGRLSDAGVLAHDISKLRAAMSAECTAPASPDSGPERQRRRSWAIWRAR